MSFDLVVIGGGINGAGIARDAATRGFSTCLVEQADLCSSTSRWSSRLIHGGLRYLEYGEIGLVYECLRERETLLATAPHLVHPLPMFIPIYTGGRRSAREIALGLTLYDLLSLRKSLPRHRRLSRDETLAEIDGLNPDGLLGGAAYHDAQVTFPERLVVENAIAARRAGAEIRLYARAESVAVRDGRVTGVVVCDLRTDVREMLEAPMVVNAGGPWVDTVLETVAPIESHMLARSRGTHIVVDAIPGLAGHALYAEAAADGRPFFIMPWNDRTLIGTTDLPFDGDPGTVTASDDEMAYLIRETNRVLPRLHLEPGEVRLEYAGVRPLMRAEGRRQAAITRRHHICHDRNLAAGLFSVVGGKLTTYRSLAEQVVDKLCRYARRDLLACETASWPLPGGAGDRAHLQTELARGGPLDAETIARLVGIYGTRAEDVTRLVRAKPALGARLGINSHAIAAEIVFGFQAEMAATVADCLFRRCMVALESGFDATIIDKALATAREHLEWSDARCAEERQQVLREAHALGIIIGTGT